MFTFGVGFAALNTGNNLLYLVLSLMLSFLVLSGVLSEMALRGIHVERHKPPEAFARHKARVQLTIENRQHRFAAHAVVVEDQRVGGRRSEAVGRCFVLRLDPGASLVRSYAFEAADRGAFEWTGFRISTRFPFGLFVKSLRVDRSDAMIVYPQYVSSASGETPQGTVGEGHSDRRRPGHGVSLIGLRDYQAGDARGRVHWRASARRGVLLVRETEHDLDLDVEVRLDTRIHGERSSRGRSEDFERRVRVATSIVVDALEAGRRVSLRSTAQAFEPGVGRLHRATLLHFLACVEPEAPTAGRSHEGPQEHVAA